MKPPPTPFSRPTALARRWVGLCAMALASPLWAADAAPAEPAFDYTTGRGDTLIGLGRRFLIDPAAWPELARTNLLPRPTRMATGTLLRIPLRLMASEPASAQVTAVFGQVRSSGGAAVVVGQWLPEGAELRTDEGNATVRLVDGTVLRLRAASGLQIQESNRVPRAGLVRSGVRVQQGQVEVQAQPATAGQPGFRLSTPQGVLGVRGTAFRVHAQGAQGATRSEVLEGAVAADGAAVGAAATPGKLVKAGFGVVVDTTGTVAPPVRLLPAPDLSQLPALHEQALVQFTLPAQEGASAYRAQVSRDASFEQLVVDVRSVSTDLRLADLPDGDYLLRVRGEDVHGLQGLNADHRFSLRARPTAPQPSAPAPRAIFSGARVELAWGAHPDARSYRVQLSSSPDFKAPLQDHRGLSARTLPLAGLVPGVYFWRLASERSSTEQGPFGAAQPFELRAPPLPLLAPQVEERLLRLSWPGLAGQSFELQVASDANFTALVLQRQLDRPSVALDRTRSTALFGRLFARVRARDADGFVGPYTDALTLDLPMPCLQGGGGRCVKAGEQPIQTLP